MTIDQLPTSSVVNNASAGVILSCAIPQIPHIGVRRPRFHRIDFCCHHPDVAVAPVFLLTGTID
jgi:hypothetical protein